MSRFKDPFLAIGEANERDPSHRLENPNCATVSSIIDGKSPDLPGGQLLTVPQFYIPALAACTWIVEPSEHVVNGARNTLSSQ